MPTEKFDAFTNDVICPVCGAAHNQASLCRELVCVQMQAVRVFDDRARELDKPHHRGCLTGQSNFLLILGCGAR